MSLPLARGNMVGVLTVSASTDLNIPVGSTLTSGSTTTSSTISVPVQCTAAVLVQLSSGTATIQVDVSTGTPAFSSPVATYQVIRGEPVFLLANTTVTVTPVANGPDTVVNTTNVAVRIINQSGTSLTVSKLGMLVLGKVKADQDVYTIANGLSMLGGPHNNKDGVANAQWDLLG